MTTDRWDLPANFLKNVPPRRDESRRFVRKIGDYFVTITTEALTDRCKQLSLAYFRRMSGERSLSSSAKARMDRVGVGVGVGADDQGTANLRAGATLMKSVSIFLMSGRKASVNSNRQISGSPKHEPRRKHRRRMPVAGTGRTSAHTVKLMELLKRKTRFSWQVKIRSTVRSFYR